MANVEETVKWDTRLANANANNPSSLVWHARRRGWDVDNLTVEQVNQLHADKTDWFQGLRLKSLNTKRLDKAARLRRQADELEKEAAEFAASWRSHSSKVS